MVHVSARLCHDADGATPIHAWNRVQPRQHRFERDQATIDFADEPFEHLVEEVDLRQDLLDEKRMMRSESSL
jgi:hypothetical protein